MNETIEVVTKMLDKCTETLERARIEKYLINLMQCLRRGTPITNRFRVQHIIEVIHRVSDLFMAQPMLIEFQMPKNGLIVVGDLHGDLQSLLKVFKTHGYPPHHHFLFLGDYVDKGLYQIEVILLLLLLKLRWPEHITMLRGNHECISVANEFALVCSNELDLIPEMFSIFNHMFDVMPVAAIISDHYLCCHGGVSQWLTCRSNIRNIPRPTYTNKMGLLEACLLTDLLWADPCTDWTRPFTLSQRGCGYQFNKKGLNAVLKSLRVKTLIRGHESSPIGVIRNFNDDSCVTVHTTPPRNTVYGFSPTLKLVQQENRHRMIPQSEMFFDDISVLTLSCQAIASLLQSFRTDFLELSDAKNCYMCNSQLENNEINQNRFVTNRQIELWMKQHIREARDCYIREFWDLESPIDRAESLVLSFPIFYDLTVLKGGNSGVSGATYRVSLCEDEKKLLDSKYPRWHSLDNKFVPISKFDRQDSMNSAGRIEQKKHLSGLRDSFQRAADGFTEIFLTITRYCTNSLSSSNPSR